MHWKVITSCDFHIWNYKCKKSYIVIKFLWIQKEYSRFCFDCFNDLRLRSFWHSSILSENQTISHLSDVFHNCKMLNLLLLYQHFIHFNFPFLLAPRIQEFLHFQEMHTIIHKHLWRSVSVLSFLWTFCWRKSSPNDQTKHWSLKIWNGS